MLSFTLAHASVVWMRHTMPSADMPYRGPLSFVVRGYDVPLFAILGGLATFVFWLVTIAKHFSDNVAPVGLAWLAIGMVVYVIYRRTQGLPLTVTVVAQAAAFGPAVEVEYRSILLPLTSHTVTDEMTVTALRLAAESGTKLIALYPIQVPLNRSLADPMEDEARPGRARAREAAALGSQYGVSVITRIVRTRNVGEAIVDEARRRGSEIIVLGAEQRKRGGERMFGRVIDYVLRNADCRVMVGTQAAGRMIAASRAIAFVFLAIGVAILAETVWLGGGPGGLPGGRGLHHPRRDPAARAPLVKHRCLIANRFSGASAMRSRKHGGCGRVPRALGPRGGRPVAPVRRPRSGRGVGAGGVQPGRRALAGRGRARRARRLGDRDGRQRRARSAPARPHAGVEAAAARAAGRRSPPRTSRTTACPTTASS